MTFAPRYAASVVCLCLLFGSAVRGDQCGPPQIAPYQQGDIYKPQTGALFQFVVQSSQEPGTCDPQVTIYETANNGVRIVKFYPCSGDSYTAYNIPNNNPGLDTSVATNAKQALTGICDADWVNENFGPGSGVTLPQISIPLRTAQTNGIPTPAGQGSQGFVFTDLNGDGNPDIVYVLATTIEVQLLNGNGSILSSNRFPTGLSVATKLSSDIIAADFNGDGHLDLAITNVGSPGTDSGAAAILLGNGDGSFQAPIPLQAGLNPLSLAAADFNGDGKTDLAVSNYSTGAAGGYGPGAIAVLFGNHDGTFAAPVTYATGEDKNGYPASLIALDINGDGFPDLATANLNDNSITVLLNAGAGKFNPPSIITLPLSVQYLAYTDLNHDNKLDLVATSSLASAFLILLGNGDGTFQSPAIYAGGDQPGSITALPLSDEYSLLIAADSLAGSVWVTLVNPQGVAGAPPYMPVGGHPTGVAAADLNGDGIPDAVLTGASSDVAVVLSGSGGYLAPLDYSLNGSSPQAVAIGDMNNDGKPDAVVAWLRPLSSS